MAEYNSNYIKPDYLYEFSGGDTDFIKEMIDTFLYQTPPILKLIDQANKDKDWEQLWRQAHKLKSSAKFMGACLVGDLSEILEREGRQNHVSVTSVEMLVSDLQMQYTIVAADFLKMKAVI